ncbi:MAG: transposase [Pseudobdellovibrionaceae bacterium]
MLLFPPLRSAWARRGKPNRVWLSGHNAKKVIFGTINLKTGHHIEMEQPKQRSENFCSFLEELHRRYHGKPLAILLDRDPSHIAKKSQKLATKLGITLVWLPVRSPELNPMESLWGIAKSKVCANRQYKTIRNEMRRFKKFFKYLPPHKALLLSGLTSEEFWLFK